MPRKKPVGLPVKRINTHRTETKSVRLIISKLPEDWLIRYLEERDYGSDMMIEAFEGDNSTGDLAILQIKGTEAGLTGKGDIKLEFPTKTLKYAEQFAHPFFAVHVSTTSNTAYFLWLQNYIKVELDRKNPKWRKNNEVTLTIPRLNNLTTKDGLDRLTKLIERRRLLEQTLRFLIHFEWMKKQVRDVCLGQLAVADAALVHLSAIQKLSIFISTYNLDFDDLDLDIGAVGKCLGQIAKRKAITNNQKKMLVSQIGKLDSMKWLCLNQDYMDEIEADILLDKNVY